MSSTAVVTRRPNERLNETSAAGQEPNSLDASLAPGNRPHEIRRQLEAIQGIVDDFATRKGKLLAADVPDAEALRLLEKDYQQATSKYSSIQQTPELRSAIQTYFKKVEDRARAGEVVARVQELEAKLGYDIADGLEGNRHILDAYLTAQKDLLDRNPEFKAELEKMADQANQLGHARWQQAQTSIKEAYAAMWGPGTTEERLFRSLEGKSADEILAIEEQYQKRYQVSLSARIEGELSGADLEYGRALLSADPVRVASAKLYRAMSGAGTDEDSVCAALEDARKAGILEDVEKHFQEHYSEQWGLDESGTPISLESVLRREMKGDDLQAALAAREGGTAQSLAIKLHGAMKGGFLGMGTTEETIYSILGDVKPEELDDLQSAYEDLYDTSLRQHLQGELSGLQEKRALLLLDGDKLGADAAALEWAMHGGVLGVGTDEKLIREVLKGTSDEYRAELRDRWKKDYSVGEVTLEKAFASELSGDNKIFTDSLLADGKLSIAEEVRLSVAGLGTEEKDLKAALTGRSAEEIAAAEKDYSEKFGGNLKDEALGDTSGEDRFDVHQLLRGIPSSPQEVLARHQERLQFELSGALSGIIDWVSHQPRVAREDLARLEKVTRKVNDRTELTGDLTRELQSATHASSTSLEGLRDVKNSLSDVVVNTGTTIVAVGATVGSFGATAFFLPTLGLLGTLGIAAATTATATGLTRTGLKAGIKGSGYGYEESLVDVGASLLEGGTVFLGGAVGKQAADATLKQIVLTQLKKVGEEVTEESVKAATSTILSRLGGRIGIGGVESSVDGALSGGIEGGYGALTTDDLFSEGLEGALRKFFTTSLVSAGTGGGMGGGFGSGFTSLGEGFGSLLRMTRKPGDAASALSDLQLPPREPKPEALLVDDPLLDRILNAPPVTDRNANLLGDTGDVDSLFDGQAPELVGAGIAEGPPYLSAALDGAPYNAKRPSSSEVPGLEASGNRNLGDGNNASGGAEQNPAAAGGGQETRVPGGRTTDSPILDPGQVSGPIPDIVLLEQKTLVDLRRWQDAPANLSDDEQRKLLLDAVRLAEQGRPEALSLLRVNSNYPALEEAQLFHLALSSQARDFFPQLQTAQREWKPSAFSDPLQHDPNKFRYIVSMVAQKVDDAIRRASTLADGKPIVCASVIDNTHTRVFDNVVGVIIEAPPTSVLAAAPRDIFSEMDQNLNTTSLAFSYLLEQFDNVGLRTPDALIKRSRKSGSYNEVLLTGRSALTQEGLKVKGFVVQEIDGQVFGISKEELARLETFAAEHGMAVVRIPYVMSEDF